MAPFHQILRRFALGFLITLTALVATSATLYAVYMHIIVNRLLEPAVPSVLAQTADSLKSKGGEYELAPAARQQLMKAAAWAMLLDKQSGEVTWRYHVPPEIHTRYTLTDVAKFSRGYLQDYPVFTWEHPGGLLVVGYPRDSFAKQLSNYIPTAAYQSLIPFWAVLIPANLTVLFLLYFGAQKRLGQAVTPLVAGIGELSRGQTVQLAERAPFSTLAQEINTVSAALQKRDTARANWIAGVSHDIRTPLSVIIGSAATLEKTTENPEVAQKARQIMAHGERIKNLVNDLNLASRLDYEMQPLRLESVPVAPLLRSIAADFLDRGYDGLYDIECEIDFASDICVTGDASLLQRAVENLVTNAIVHNPQGCQIRLEARMAPHEIIITITDNGTGVSAEKLRQLETRPHYWHCDTPAEQPQHGLGLLLVNQIIAAHHATMRLSGREGGGFAVELHLSPSAPPPS
ncbi:HAMP domain-containing histidine kinase [Mobiluncus mulieris]|uniref:histidine kinase n=1 Tax=Mobiluncus mulieris TaxID=2052 RepID=A0A7Y0U390_9ACTO|nr:HAMP domain-containing sensor histidine kinase [Mobiluncus mulieris]NMW66161.1 HAMP domain-containing histidine kinase [Mobiluncus mulieris]